MFMWMKDFVNGYQSRNTEYKHDIVGWLPKLPWLWKLYGAKSHIGNPALSSSIAGISLPSPVGIAAGFDKNCLAIPYLLDMGFGFVCGGTITLDKRAGNPRPRLFQNRKQKSIVNSFGFPNDGLSPIVRRLMLLDDDSRSRTFISISGDDEYEFIECYQAVAPLVAGIEINISSPNSYGLRAFHDCNRLRDLIILLKQSLPGLDRPLLVKMYPWANETQERRKALDLIETAVDAGADGVVVANSRPVHDDRLAVGKGGLSGKPLLKDTERMTFEASYVVGEHASIIACGGISTAEDVFRMFDAGACATQLYSAFTFHGFRLPSKINEGLLRLTNTIA